MSLSLSIPFDQSLIPNVEWAVATPLVFHFRDSETACHLAKVDRNKLYGYVDTEVVDKEGRICSLATLAGDGRTLMGPGGVTFGYVDADGQWREKKELTAVDENNDTVEPVSSSFKAPIELSETASIPEYLNHNIRAVYLMSSEDGFSGLLLEELGKGTIFRFPFSYRGGLDPDVGFLLRGADENIWMCLGRKADIQMVGLKQTAVLVEEAEDADEDDDLLDFGVL